MQVIVEISVTIIKYLFLKQKKIAQLIQKQQKAEMILHIRDQRKRFSSGNLRCF